MSFLRGVRGLLRSPPSTVRARLSAQPAVMLRPVRAFHVSIRTASQVIADQDPETGLYYHEIDNGTYAVSFLKRPPKNPTSIAVIAHVTSANNSPDEQLRHSPDKVWINPAFFDALHHVLKANVADDETLMVEANLRKNGFAHLFARHHDA
ncbi:hypothetical protein MVES1_002394 [Malassezia vespertilionis]|uniref:uncharacterized protein n=1 Tax=Malassezia vespertilionis TaxID=2020962 RepID=UPI0024B260EE|nr:uncharacterized protein MVES1_002394 [Malassezia vespertilionis]WFD07038.1 hypothetical protein MVES1_002394 [Malassezia vespertilionis]